MSNKTKMGGCKKKIRAHKVSKGQRRSIAKLPKADLSLINAHRYQ